jgi:hypothetical protein
MMNRRLKISALLATVCAAGLPRAAWAQAADAPPAAAEPGPGTGPAADAPAPPVADAPEAKPAEEAAPEAKPEEAPAPVAAEAKAEVSVAAPAAPAAPSGDRLARPGYVPGYRGYVGVGMSPYIPRVGALPGGMTPSFGAPSPSDDWSFNFTGFMSASVRASINTRDNPRDGQSGTVLHATPQNVEVYGSFNDTGATPGNWVGMLFQYGNRYVTANVSFDTHNPSRAASYNIVGSQYFLNDTFLSIRVPPIDKLRLAWNVGFFSQPYGYLGQYGGGLYTPPLFGRVSGAGETVTAEYDLTDSMTLIVEDGFSGGNRTGKVPDGAINTGSTNFSDSNLPSSYVHHAHVGLRIKGDMTLQFMGHFMTNWSQSDQVESRTFDNSETKPWDERYPKDGHIHVAGIEAKAISQSYGYLALGAALIESENSFRLRGLSTYATDGVGLTNDWFGTFTGGTGKILLAGINYKFSLGAIMRAPEPFWGDGPDLVFEVATQVAKIESDDPFNGGRFKNKQGLDVLYTFIPWLGVGLRMDRVAPNSKDAEETFYALAPRLQFRSNWQSHETVTLKYSKWFYGDHTHSDSWDARPREQLDDQMIALGFGMWW